MGIGSSLIVEDYRKAREESDFATQAGILTSLLSMLMESKGEALKIARETAREVLLLREAA